MRKPGLVQLHCKNGQRDFLKAAVRDVDVAPVQEIVDLYEMHFELDLARASRVVLTCPRPRGCLVQDAGSGQDEPQFQLS